MRRALATATIAGALIVVPVSAAVAADLPAGPAILAQSPDTDEPASQDGDDDTGKYGLAGLAGLIGLFGYKKYRDHRTTTTTTTPPRPAGTDGTPLR